VDPNYKEQFIMEGTNASICIPNFHYADEVTLKRVGEEDIVGRGDGSYLNEFNVVASEIREGLKESKLVPLDDSIAVMRILDTCRANAGFKFPFED
jgi:hypothetical protein